MLVAKCTKTTSEFQTWLEAFSEREKAKNARTRVRGTAVELIRISIYFL